MGAARHNKNGCNPTDESGALGCMIVMLILSAGCCNDYEYLDNFPQLAKRPSPTESTRCPYWLWMGRLLPLENEYEKTTCFHHRFGFYFLCFRCLQCEGKRRKLLPCSMRWSLSCPVRQHLSETFQRMLPDRKKHFRVPVVREPTHRKEIKVKDTVLRLDVDWYYRQ